MFSPIWGEGNGRGISGFEVNRGAVYRGFTVYCLTRLKIYGIEKCCGKFGFKINQGYY